MSRKLFLPAVGGLAALVGVSFTAQGVLAATSLNMSTCLPRNHDQVEAYFETFVKKMKSDESMLKLKYKGGPEITPRKQQGAALQRGILDVILCPTYYVGQVPEARALTPSTASPAKLRRNGGYDMLQVAWAKGMNARILGWGNHGGAQFHFYLSFEPKLDRKTGFQFEGKKMRSTAIYNPFLVAMGATPVNMGMTDLYTALERGVVKGFVWPEGGVAKFGWPKFIKYRVEVPFFRSSTTVMMNLDKYKSLSNKARKQIDAAGLFYEENSGGILRKKADSDNKKVFAAGVKKMRLEEPYASALVNTIYGSSWEKMKKYKFRVDKAKLKAKLFDDN
jgi:TRAP-type mannitol/chloroaromatic compound transport system substrate-binding protein